MAERERQFVEQATAVFSELDVNQDKLVAVDELLSLKEFDADNDGQVSVDEARSCLGGRDVVDYETFEQSVWNNMRLTYRQKDGRYVTKPEPEQFEHAMQEPAPSDSGVEIEEDSAYDDRTKLLIAAAKRACNDFDEVGRKLTSITNEMKELHRLLQEAGPSQFFFIQSGCVDVADRENIYTLCPFHKVIQQISSTGHTVLLGKWSRWVDEPGKSGVIQLYDEGDQCATGQNTSAKVELECSSYSELVFVEESQRCRYNFTLRTPAACSQPPPVTFRDPFHGEL